MRRVVFRSLVKAVIFSDMAARPPTFEQIIDTLREGVFISHIVPEKAIALVLPRHIRAAFRGDFSVFVASDQTSIEGGREWL
jgi:hypothetical protein